MFRARKPLSRLEHLIMDALWRKGPCSSEDVRAALAARHPMKESTARTVLKRLEEKGYVTIDKKFVGRKPQTTCRLSKSGKHAFARYLDHLQAIVQQGRGQGRGQVGVG